MNEYEAALDSGKLPVERGVALTPEDVLRKEVIMGLMNNLCLDFAHIESKFNIDFKVHFATELESLKEYEEVGLIIYTSPTGGMIIRNIAMCFDTHSFTDKNAKRFSKTI